MNIALWLERAAADRPAAPALLHGTATVADYTAFRRRAAGFASWLGERGIGPGERVALFLKNRPDYLVALYGCWIAGVAAVPVNAKLHPREVDGILDDAGARLVVVDDGAGREVTGAPRLDVTGPDFAAACARPDRRAESLGPEALAWLFYTSGTTGRPKGVIITHGMLAAMSLAYLRDVDAVRPEDAAYYGAPMSHGAGLYSPVHTLAGAAHLSPPSGGFDADEMLGIARAHGSLSAFMAPTMVQRLTAAARAAGADGAGIRTIVYGGGPMYRADIEEALAVLGPRFVQIYGQGECPMAITALPRAAIADRHDPRWADRVASVGRAQSAVEVRVVDEAGRPVPPGETGEIVVRGLPVMPGYWRAPEASAAALRDGWLWTGDRGTLDADGHVTLKDRSKDVIISGGTNIYPREVEEVLLTHPGVVEVSVIGRPSPEWGEDVVAYVVRRDAGAADAPALDAHCLSAMARFKRPKAYRFVDALPKNAYGKVLKTALRTLEAATETG
ncbi:class I adenylate-forming enzyme family protein [Azospirillum sp. ST 5-10]|uniref:class I adenylate-forming enzyme family protein n=1 Tax=unclassified Azospirillum TaxID=2630922 RepID=UPI003F4A7B74